MKSVVANLVFNDFRNDARVEKISRSLVGAGYEVTVFATAGHDLPVAAQRDGYGISRPSLASRPVKRVGRVFSACRTSLRLLARSRAFDVIHCNDLEPLAFAIFAKLVSGGRIKVVYDAHELETEKHASKGFRKHLSRVLERCLVRYVDAILTVSPSIADWYRDAYGVSPPKVVLNCPHNHNGRKTDALRLSLSIPKGKKIILFQGSFSPGRGLPELLETFEANNSPPDCVLVFLGFGALHTEGMELQERVEKAAASCSNIFFHTAVPQEELLQLTASADIGVCFTEDMCLSHRYSLPNKLFEYAMSGVPMIVSDLPEMRQMVERYDCGVVCRSLTTEGIRASLDRLFSRDGSKLSANARLLAQENCWEVQEKKLLAVYENLLKAA